MLQPLMPIIRAKTLRVKICGIEPFGSSRHHPTKHPPIQNLREPLLFLFLRQTRLPRQTPTSPAYPTKISFRIRFYVYPYQTSRHPRSTKHRGTKHRKASNLHRLPRFPIPVFLLEHWRRAAFPRQAFLHRPDGPLHRLAAIHDDRAGPGVRNGVPDRFRF